MIFFWSLTANCPPLKITIDLFLMSLNVIRSLFYEWIWCGYCHNLLIVCSFPQLQKKNHWIHLLNHHDVNLFPFIYIYLRQNNLIDPLFHIQIITSTLSGYKMEFHKSKIAPVEKNCVILMNSSTATVQWWKK